MRLNNNKIKYYQTSYSTSISQIGCYPQTKGVPDGYTVKWYDNEDSMTKLQSKELPGFKPDLKWELKEDALLTDVISASNITAKGFLMNKKTKDIFEHQNLIDHKFHDAILIIKGIKYSYYYLQLVNDNLDMIIFKDSVFCVTNPFRMKEEEVIVSSFDDLKDKQSELVLGKLISAEKIKLMKSFSYDLFFLPLIHNKYFISEKFKDILIDNKISGLDFEEQDIIW